MKRSSRRDNVSQQRRRERLNCLPKTSSARAGPISPPPVDFPVIGLVALPTQFPARGASRRLFLSTQSGFGGSFKRGLCSAATRFYGFRSIQVARARSNIPAD